jgi:hypothetical protein
LIPPDWRNQGSNSFTGRSLYQVENGIDKTEFFMQSENLSEDRWSLLIRTQGTTEYR